jgi:hypothetical protein
VSIVERTEIAITMENGLAYSLVNFLRT